MPLRASTPILLASLFLGLVARIATAEGTPPTEEQARFFERKVRPVLAEHCSKCHGPQKQKAGLRLDSRAAILTGGETGPAVVAGKPEESLLVAAIRHGEDGPKMPPSQKLPAEVVNDLTRWVEMGAPWPGADAAASGAEPGPAKRKGELQITDKDRSHWAFRPITRPAVPPVKDPGRAANPIDAFILARLDAKGFAPDPPASPRELIRRATYDLTGLPPTPAEVDAFAADPSPAAYEALVDRLLASPRYGEKWGRHWLDLVRYAETNSYERDGVKPNAWRYRDYVIRSLNADKSFDRFAAEQLAGDELPDATPDSVVATGYYRLGIWDDEPSDRDQARYDGYDDLVATTGQVFLGLTIDCARCHDHKLDPIPQKDYYRLLAFFRNVNHYRNGGPTDEAPIFADAEARAADDRRVEALKRKRDELRAEAGRIEDEFRSLMEKERKSAVGRSDLDDLRYRYYRDTWDRLPDFDALKPEAAGSLDRPYFDLAPRTRDDAFGFVFEGTLIVPKAGVYTFKLDSDDGSRLTVDGRAVLTLDGLRVRGKRVAAKVDLAAGRVPIRLDYFQKSSGFGLGLTWSGPGFADRPLSAEERDRTPRPAREIDVPRIALGPDGEHYLGAERHEHYKQLRTRLKAIEKEMLPGVRALCVTEAGREAPETRVLLRGNPQTPGDPVEPGFPLVLGSSSPSIPTPPPGAKTTGRRRALAAWIGSAENPLTPRVVANRVWQGHFGRGIVRSSSNFGLQGDRPTHPELLDWLASELLANGWRLKPLHRLIMTSNAYRMASKADPRALASDPTNDLFWRFEMRRLSAEEVRDSVLAVSGNLSLKMFGPGVYPEIPAEVMAGQSVPGAGWGISPPDDRARRSIYIHAKRSLLVPILEAFDAAETDRSSPTRFATTQPTQALAMLNGSFLNAQAGVFADRLRREAGEDRGRRIALALRLATSRSPAEAEVRRALDLIAGLEARGMGPDEAFRSFCLVVLNLNEFLYLD